MTVKRIRGQKQRDDIAAVKTSFVAGKTPAQIDSYIDTNVTDLASAKEVLKKLARLVFRLARLL